MEFGVGQFVVGWRWRGAQFTKHIIQIGGQARQQLKQNEKIVEYD